MTQRSSGNAIWTPGDSEQFYKVEALMLQLPSAQRRLFICDCVERIIHLFEVEFPQDHRLKNAIQVVRRYAASSAGVEELAAAHREAGEAVYLSEAEEGLAVFKQWPPYYLASGVFIATDVDELKVNSVDGSRLVIKAVEVSGGSRCDEEAWQYQQVLSYLNVDNE